VRSWYDHDPTVAGAVAAGGPPAHGIDLRPARLRRAAGARWPRRPGGPDAGRHAQGRPASRGRRARRPGQRRGDGRRGRPAGDGRRAAAVRPGAGRLARPHDAGGPLLLGARRRSGPQAAAHPVPQKPGDAGRPPARRPRRTLTAAAADGAAARSRGSAALARAPAPPAPTPVRASLAARRASGRLDGPRFTWWISPSWYGTPVHEGRSSTKGKSSTLLT